MSAQGLCGPAQNHLLSVRLQNSLHERCPPNCQDLLSWLPAHVVSKVLGYLDPVSLARCSAVCRSVRPQSSALVLPPSVGHVCLPFSQYVGFIRSASPVVLQKLYRMY